MLLKQNSGSTTKSDPVQYVQKSQVEIHYSKHELVDAADVEEYTGQLKEEYLKIIKQNKRILL